MASQMGRTAATRVTSAVLVFIASLLVLDRAVSAGLTRLGRWAEGQSVVRRTLEALPAKASYQVLVLGTSRTFEAVHPSHIERALGVKAFKEASKGKGLRYAYEFYKIYRETVGTPKVVLYGVDYFLFGLRSDAGPLSRLHPGTSGPAQGGAPFMPLLTLARKASNDRAILAALERAQQRLSSGSGAFDPEHNQADMAAYTGRESSRVVPRPEPARYERIPFARFPGVEGEFLLRLLEACAADRVMVMFVYPPDYLATRRTNHEHDAFASELRRVIAGAPHAFFFDYDDPTRFRTADPSLFWDGDYGNQNSHLSRRGAEEFARLYLSDLARVLEAAR
jgi:hypothetical protein